MTDIVFQNEARANKNGTSRISIRDKRNVAIIIVKQFFVRRIIEAKPRSRAAGAMWSGAG
jgi:hypothetical protein